MHSSTTILTRISQLGISILDFITYRLLGKVVEISPTFPTDIVAQYPQLIFRDTAEDTESDFFVAYMSRLGHKLTLVRPPRRVGEQLGPRLRNAWPFKIAAQSATESEIYSIELKRNAFGGIVHPNNSRLEISHPLTQQLRN